MGKNVLITGGAGFIGSNWARHLLATSDARVHIFDNLSREGAAYNLESLKESAPAGRLQATIADVRDAAAVRAAVVGADEVYHFAAQVAVTSSIADPRTDFEVNLGGTLNVLEAARRAPRQPFLLFTSTNKVYGDMNHDRRLLLTRSRYSYAEGNGVAETQPLDLHSPYGCSKGAADQYVRDYSRVYHLPAVVFRMSCIAGPGQFGTEDQGWIAHFIYSALDGRPLVIYGDGRQVRDVLHISDLVKAFDSARLNRERTEGQIYNIGGGAPHSVSLLEMLERITAATGKKIEPLMDRRRAGDQLIYISDHAKFTRDTGWLPEKGIEAVITDIIGWRNANQAAFARLQDAIHALHRSA